MQEFSMDTDSWKAFWDRWGGAINQMPGMKEYMLQKIGERVQESVRSAVDASGITDTDKRVKNWQNPHIGSGKGYVAVRADSVEVVCGYKHKGKVNAGALTNFLVSGHRVRPPSGRWKRYKPRFQKEENRGSSRMTRVRGHDFYKKARAEAEKIAIQEAETFLNRLTVTELQL